MSVEGKEGPFKVEWINGQIALAIWPSITIDQSCPHQNTTQTKSPLNHPHVHNVFCFFFQLWDKKFNSDGGLSTWTYLYLGQMFLCLACCFLRHKRFACIVVGVFLLGQFHGLHNTTPSELVCLTVIQINEHFFPLTEE